MKIIEAYKRAYKEITEKGYNTYSVQDFSEGPYEGTVFLLKKATWNSKIKTVYRVRFKDSRKLLIEKDKKDFLKFIGVVK